MSRREPTVALVIERKKAIAEMKNHLRVLLRERNQLPIKQAKDKARVERNNLKAFKPWYASLKSAVKAVATMTFEEVYEKIYASAKPSYGGDKLYGNTARIGLSSPPEIYRYTSTLTVQKLHDQSLVLQERIRILELSSSKNVRMTSDKWHRFSRGL